MSLANFSLTGCPAPFLSENDFPGTGGYIEGRYCGASPLNSKVRCCLPCPVQQWIYPEDYIDQLRIPSWIGIASLSLTGFLIISFIVLPPKQTHRHYLSMGLLFPVLFIALAFVIPLGTNPELCYNEITPNGMHEDLSCAWTGALLPAGGIGSVVWVLLRNIWLHIRVCWDQEPGRPFFILSILAGTIIPAVLLTAVLVKTGVSYRTGQTCLTNHENSIATFWVWLVAFSGIAFILSIVTLGYCVWVYVKSVRKDRSPRFGSGGLENGGAVGGGNPMAMTTLQHWRKIRQLILIQWRNILVSMLVIVEAVYFVTVFWAQDIKLGNVSTRADDQTISRTWSACLVLTGGDKLACMEYANGLMVPRTTIIASLILASLVGPELFILLARTSMFTAWWHLLTAPWRSLKEYQERRRDAQNLTSFEMIAQNRPDEKPRKDSAQDSSAGVEQVPQRPYVASQDDGTDDKLTFTGANPNERWQESKPAGPSNASRASAFSFEPAKTYAVEQGRLPSLVDEEDSSLAPAATVPPNPSPEPLDPFWMPKPLLQPGSRNKDTAQGLDGLAGSSPSGNTLLVPSTTTSVASTYATPVTSPGPGPQQKEQAYIAYRPATSFSQILGTTTPPNVTPTSSPAHTPPSQSPHPPSLSPYRPPGLTGPAAPLAQPSPAHPAKLEKLLSTGTPSPPRLAASTPGTPRMSAIANKDGLPGWARERLGADGESDGELGMVTKGQVGKGGLGMNPV